jgi:hypothetical protein
LASFIQAPAPLRAREVLQNETIYPQILKTGPACSEARKALRDILTAQRYRALLDLGTAESPTIQGNR